MNIRALQLGSNDLSRRYRICPDAEWHYEPKLSREDREYDIAVIDRKLTDEEADILSRIVRAYCLFVTERTEMTDRMDFLMISRCGRRIGDDELRRLLEEELPDYYGRPYGEKFDPHMLTAAPGFHGSISWHGFTDKLFEKSVGGVSLYIMLYAGICILCYISDVKADDRPGLLYRSMSVVFAVYAAFAAFVDWHPQWLIPLVLSLSFLVSFTGNNRILLLTAVLEPLLILESDTECNIVYMVEDGLLPVGDHKYSGVSFAGILDNASPFAMSFVRSVAAVILIYLAVFFYRRRDRFFGNGTVYAADRRLLTGRVIIFYAFLVFCFWCYCYIG